MRPCQTKLSTHARSGPPEGGREGGRKGGREGGRCGIIEVMKVVQHTAVQTVSEHKTSNAHVRTYLYQSHRM